MKTTKPTTVSLRTNRKNRTVRKSGLRGILATSAAALLTFCSLTGSASAQQFFDNNGAAAGLGNNGGSLNWDLVTTNWGTASGTTAGVVWANTATSDAVFAGTAGNIAQQAVPITVRNITFNVTGYLINNANAANPMTFAPNATITVTNVADSASITSFTAGTSGLTVAGPGTLTFSGFGTNAYTGTTSVTGGTLNLNKSISNATIPGNMTIGAATVNLQTSNQIADASVVTLNNAGATFAIGAQSDTVGGVSLVNGQITGTTGVLTSTSAFDVQSGTVSAILGGGVGLTKTTGGTVTLSGANTYTGATIVNDGTLSLTVANALPTGTVLTVGSLVGSVLNPVVNLNGNAQSVGGINFIAGNGANPTISLGGGTLTLTGNVNLTSNTTTPGAGGSSYIGFFSTGVLDLGGAVRTFNIASQGQTTNGDLQVNALVQNGGITMVQTAASAGGGPATLRLSGANTYAGLTTVTSGVIRVANNSALGSVAAGTVVGSTAASTATLELNNGINVAAEALSINGKGAVSGAGNLGALRVTGSGNAATYGGAITANSDATISAGAAGNTLTLTGGISKNGVNLTLGGLTATNARGTINVNSVISGAAANSDLIVESATVNLNAANTYNGQTFIRSTALAGTGILNANVAGALPDPTFGAPARSAVTMDDATSLGGSVLNLNGAFNQVVASLTSPDTAIGRSATINLNSNTLTIGNSLGGPATTFTGTITGAAPGFAIIKDGTSTQILTGANTYIGFTAVNGGTLQVGDGVRAGSQLGTGLVFVNPTATLDINLANNGTFANTVQTAAGSTVRSISANTQTLTGAINGAGNFIANGGGRTIFANANTYQAGTTVSNNSTLQVGTAAAAATAGQNIATNVITLGGGGGTGTLNVVNVAGGILANNITGAAGVLSTVTDFGAATTTTLTGSITDGTGAILVTALNAGTTLILANANNTYTGTGSPFGSLAFNGGTLQIGTATRAGSVGTGALDADNGGTITLVNIAGNALANNVTNGVSGTGTFNVNSTNTNTISGVISNGAGTLNLIQSGTGTTILTGANTYNTTTISGGTLQVGAGGAVGTLGISAVTNNAILTINRNNAITIVNNISGTGVFNQAGTGITTLSGANTYTGATNVLAGTLVLGSTGALGSAASFSSVVNVTSGATLDLNGFSPAGASPLNLGGNGVGGNGALTNNGATGVTYTGGVTLTSATTVATPSSITLNGVVSGNFALTKIGAATLTLNGINNYSGVTNINAGIVIAGNASALGSIGAGTTVANGAALSIANGIFVVAEPLIINGAGAGVAAPGALTQAAGGTSSFAGPITAATNATINANGGTLTLTGGINKNGVNLTLAGTAAGGTINIRTVGISGAAANSDLIVDSATVNEDVANSYNGQTFIRSTAGAGLGVLQTGVANALPTLFGRSAVTMDDGASLGGSVLNIGGTPLNPAGANQSIASLVSATGTSSVTLGANTLTIGFGTGVDLFGTAGANFAGVISGTGGLIKDETSTQILSGANTFTGPVSVTGGTLSLQNGAAIADVVAVTVTTPGILNLINSEVIGSLAGTGNVTLNANLLTTGGNNTTTTFSGVMSGNGAASLIKTGTGTFTLSGANTFTGTAVVNNGILSLQNGAAIADVVAVTVTNPGVLNLVNSETIGSLAGTGNVTLNANLLTTGGNNASTTFSGVMSGNGAASLIKTGTGTMTLSGANTFTGTAVVNNGILSLQNGAAIADVVAVTVTNPGVLNLVNSETIGSLAGNGNTTLNANTLTTGGNNTSTNYSGVMSGNGVNSLIKTGTGTFTLQGANTFTGTAVVNNGILSLQNGAAIADVVAVTVTAPGALNLVNSETIGSLAGSGNTTLNANTLTTGGNNTSTVYSGVMSGNGVNSLVKAGTGTMTLGGLNTYTGATNVTGGILRAGSTQAFGVNSAVTVGAAGQLDLAGNSNSIGSLAGVAGGIVQSTVGAATLTTGGDNTSTAFAGVVQNGTGPLSLVKNGTGTQTLSGLNTYTGTTTVNGGSLLAGSTSAFGNNSAVTVNAGGTLDLAGNSNSIGSLAGAVGGTVQSSVGAATLTTGGLNTSTTYAGLIQNGVGPLAFVKNGTGFQTLTGTNTFTGGTTLNAGTLGAGSTNAFGSGNLTVNGGTLQTVGGPLIVNIGGGNIALNGGTTVFNVGGTTAGVTHDQFLTTGTVGTISGPGRLTLVQQNGYLLQPGDKVNLIVAGNVTGGSKTGTALPAGTVDGLSAFSNTPLLVPTVNLYIDPSVTLEAMQGSFAGLNGQSGQGGTIRFTPNQLAVARALDSVSETIGNKTGIFKELNFLDTQSLSTLASNLDKIAPEELTSIFRNSVALANVQSANLQRRMEEIATQASAPSAAGLAAAGSGPAYSGGLAGPAGKRSKEIMPPSNERWGAFLTGTGEFTRVGSTTNAAGYKLETGGITGGLDYRLTENFAIGLDFGYMNTSASLANGGNIDTDGGRLGIYATYFDRGFHMDAAVNGGLNSYKTRRVTPNNTAAIASPDGSEINVLFATGYDWKSGHLTFGPTASYQYTNTSLDGFTETGAFAPLTVGSKSAQSHRTSVGMRAFYDAHVGGVIVRPEAKLSWQHEFDDNSYAITSRFATLGGNPFTVAGPSIGRDSLLIGAGFSVLWNSRLSTFVYYDGEVGRSNYDSHSISGGLRLQF